MTPAAAAHLTASGEPFRIYDATQLRSMLTEAGFSRVDIAPYRENALKPDGRTIQRDFHLVRAIGT